MILKLEDGSSIQVKFEHHQKPGARLTLVDVILSTDGIGGLRRGVAFVHPNDPYCKATGRKVALARAIQAFPRRMRTQIWKAYFEYIGAPQREKKT